MPSKPTQRTLAYLEKNGWTCCVVEKWLPARGTMKFGRRIDAFGFGDILACRTILNLATQRGEGEIALVQTTAAMGGGFIDHWRKIAEDPKVAAKAAAWKAAGGIILLHGWAKRNKDGKRGARKVWTVREERL